ncbi:MAG: acyl-protein synthetase [Polyangiales bacterium]
MTDSRARLHRQIRDFIAAHADGSRDDAARDALLCALAEDQITHVAPYARFCAQRRVALPLASPDRIPALPTDAFRFARIARHAEAHDVRRFRSSGTTSDSRSLHALTELSLYDAAAEAAARVALFADVARMRLVLLVPSEHELPDSSLSYMLARFLGWFGTEGSGHVWPVGPEHVDALSAHLREAERTGEPVAVLGTSFALVHAIDALAETRFQLPRGSRVMQTGGFKGRSRTLTPEAMRALLVDALGVDHAHVVAEYGMTELSSQLYETTLRWPDAPRRLWWPSWVRVSVVDPETFLPVSDGTLGLVRIDDLANLDGVACIQTADLGVLDAYGLTLHGRASDAVARGCSIGAAELLGEVRG